LPLKDLSPEAVERERARIADGFLDVFGTPHGHRSESKG
jgi:hypothetical protein